MESLSANQDNNNHQITDLTYLNDLADGNFDFVAEMINMFLNSVPQSVSDLSAAIDNNDWDKVKSIAHRIKPSFGFVGVKNIQEILNQMERNAMEAPDPVAQKKMVLQVSQALEKCVAELQLALDKNQA